MKFRNYFPRDQQLQQNKHPPPMVPKFEDPVAKAPLETNGAEVNKSILCSLFVLFVCIVLWSKAFCSHEGTKACAFTVHITGCASHGV
jgi:hypothetical protein